MFYFVHITSKNHFERVVSSLSGRNITPSVGFYASMMDSYGDMSPCLIYRAGQKFTQYANRRWCLDQRYTEKDPSDLVPQHLFDFD